MSGPHMIELPEDVKSREGMVLFLAISELKNLVKDLSDQVSTIHDDSVDPSEFRKFKVKVEELESLVTGAKNIGKTVIKHVIEKAIIAGAVLLLGSDLVVRLFK